MLYLKYRPQTVSQLDSTEVRKRMEAVIAKKPLPHAFLLLGPKGTGKTSTARILAKVANCLEPTRSGDACGRCEACLRIANGEAVDLVEIDAASNRRIDDVRALRDKVNLLPSELKRKVYIIDEAHMLTREAFNALLKTLEEPPEHVMFVLGTTEPSQVPETIRSRCLEVKFRKATLQDLVSKLIKVAKAEKIKLTEEAARGIAGEADGSFRDAIKLLEQLAERGEPIDEKLVERELKAYINLADKLYRELLGGQTDKALALVSRVVDEGVEVSALLKNMAGRAVDEAVAGYLAGESKEAVGQKLELSSVVGEAYAEYMKLAEAKIVLNRLVLSWLAKLEPGAKNHKAEPGGTGSAIGAPIKKQPPKLGKNTDKPTTGNLVHPVQDRQPAKNYPPGQGVGESSNSPLSLDQAVQVWNEVLQLVKPKNHGVGALLQSAKLVAVEAGVYKVEVFYQFHKDRLETPKCRKIVQEALDQVAGRGYRINYFLGQKPVVSKKIDNLAETGETDQLLDMAEEIFGK